MTVKLRCLLSMSDTMATHEKASTASSPSSDEPLTAEGKENIRIIMLDRLSGTSAHFEHRQRDAPDLTMEEKFNIAAEVLQKNPVTFLERFGKFLHPSDLPYFQESTSNQDRDYQVQFYIREIAHRCAHSDTIVKNRRYAAMQELDAGGVYFSEDEMKHREPLLFEEMIGQYMSAEELQQQAESAIDRSDLRLSTILINHMDALQEKAVYDWQKEREECQREEEEDSDDEDDNDGKEGEKPDDEELTEDLPEISDVRATTIWRQQQREEFRSIMHEKFLSGSDSQFDYSKVDSNPDYDSLATLSQDEEQKYFLSEDPQNIDEEGSRFSSSSSMDTNQATSSKMEEEEEEDYMLYEPPPDLVAKSSHFAKLGSWSGEADTDNGS